MAAEFDALRSLFAVDQDKADVARILRPIALATLAYYENLLSAGATQGVALLLTKQFQTELLEKGNTIRDSDRS